MDGSQRDEFDVAVIGAGAAGLSLAYYLQQQGVGRCIVLEKTAEVGGKCRTIAVDGRNYDVGAIIFPSVYRNVFALAEAAGVPRQRIFSACFLGEGGKVERFPSLPALFARRLRAVYGASLRYDQIFRQAGFGDVAAEFGENTTTFAQRRGLTSAFLGLAQFGPGFGYGFLEEVPVAYYLKYMTVTSFPAYEILPGGIGHVFQGVAKQVDVRRGCVVERIERGADGVVVSTQQGTFRSRKLVFAMPLEETCAFTDWGEADRALFAKIRYTDFQTVIADMNGMPDHGRFIFVKPFLAAQAGTGQPVSFSRRWPDTNVHIAYFHGGSSLGGTSVVARDTAVNRVGTYLKSIGASLGQVHGHFAWKYFPHVGSADFQQGFYRQLETLQGVKSTYLAGELLSFGCLELVTRYSETLAARIAADLRRSAIVPDAA